VRKVFVYAEGSLRGMDRSFSVSESAQKVVDEARRSEADPDTLGLWIEVVGASGESYTYDVYFQETKHASLDDLVIRDGETPIVIPNNSIDALSGAKLDLDDEGGLVIVNPNSPSVAPKVDLDFGPEALTNELALRVSAVLADEINPSIAAHGGRADLVGVVEDTAYVVMGGGCQGCGLAAVTLSQGITVAIREAVPEIKQVVDVTDHASGSNPFYQEAKK